MLTGFLKKYVFLSLFAGSILLPGPSFSQIPSFQFERLTIEDGLPHPSVLDVLQDNKGFIWIGTGAGIVRYDGIKMKYYFPAAEGQGNLPELDFPRFFEDTSGNLWLTLRNQKAKLFCFDPYEDRFIPYLFDPDSGHSHIAGYPSGIFEDNLGRLLVGTWGDGLYVIDKERDVASKYDVSYKRFTHNPDDSGSIADDAISLTMAKDSEGNIWMPTDKGLNKFIPGADRFETFLYKDDPKPLSKEYTSVFLETPNTLWVGSILHGLLQFDLQEERFVKAYPVRSSPSGEMDKIFEVAGFLNGDLLLTVASETVYRGLVLFKPEDGTFYPVHQIGGNQVINITSTTTDQTGNLWIGAWQKGLYKLNPEKARFRFYQTGFYNPETPVNERKKINCMYQDSRGYTWIGTGGDGLIKWDPAAGIIQHFSTKGIKGTTLRSDWINDIIELNENGFLISSEKGLDYLNTMEGSVHPIRDYTNEYPQFHRQKNGNLYIRSWNKGFCIVADPHELTLICYDENAPQKSGSFPLSGITTIQEDSQGKVWIGLNQNGLFEFDPGTETFIHHKISLGVHSIHFDREDNCWFAAYSAGLKLFDRETGTVIHPKETSFEEIGIVRGILEDDRGKLWLKTTKGIVQFNPSTRKVMRFFSRQNWMDTDAPWFSNSRGYKAPDGNFYFESPSGILQFHPDSLEIDTFPPGVVMTQLKVSGQNIQPGNSDLLEQPISETTHFEFTHKQNDLQLSFAALHFKSPEENRFSYFLSEYDEDWSEPTTSSTVSYSNLSPGNYTFQVKAFNSDGFPGPVKRYSILIHPPWWKTWWAYLAYFCLFMSIMIAFRRYELRRLRAKSENQRLLELDRAKSRLYTNITHEFRTPLTVMLGLTGELKKQSDAGMKNSLETISRNGKQLLSLVNQMLDLAKLESGHMALKMMQGDIIAFTKYLTDSFASLAHSRSINLSFSSTKETFTMDYDPERLQQVVSNLLTNALKFTPEGGKVDVKVDNVGEIWLIKVEDTGIGISEKELPRIFDRFYQADDQITRGSEGSGIGLALTKELVRLMDGKVEVSSKKGEGTVFTVRLPVTRNAVQFTKSFPESNALQMPTDSDAGFEPVPAPSDHGAGKPLLLLVEDNPDLIAYMHSFLNGRYRILTAGNGEEGLKQSFVHIPDLVISDVMMPVMDGYTFCKKLKYDQRTSHIPVILLTAKADKDSKMEGFKGGADAYISKPFQTDELLVRIENLLKIRLRLQRHYLRLAGLPDRQDLPDGEEQLIEEEGQFLTKTRTLIESHMEDADFSVTKLNELLGMSRTQLHRKMKSLTGLSTNQFIREIRIQKARELLRDTDMNIAEISYKIGYSAPDYFSKVFKKETGYSPGDFRIKGK